MDHPKFAFSRAFWMVCACLLLLPYFATAAEPLLAKDTRAPLQRVAAADHDGDHQPELIAHGSHSMVHVWTRRHKRIQSFGLRAALPFALTQSHHHRVDDDRDSESSDAISPTTFAPVSPLLCPLPRAPDLIASNAGAPHTAPARRSFTPLDPFLPRPPPTHTAL
jgi:hypothetical protein